MVQTFLNTANPCRVQCRASLSRSLLIRFSSLYPSNRDTLKWLTKHSLNTFSNRSTNPFRASKSNQFGLISPRKESKPLFSTSPDNLPSPFLTMPNSK